MYFSSGGQPIIFSLRGGDVEGDFVQATMMDANTPLLAAGARSQSQSMTPRTAAAAPPTPSPYGQPSQSQSQSQMQSQSQSQLHQQRPAPASSGPSQSMDQDQPMASHINSRFTPTSLEPRARAPFGAPSLPASNSVLSAPATVSPLLSARPLSRPSTMFVGSSHIHRVC
jgi:hypothetical protein